MAKKKHAEEHENLERWLVSYADFMTLLFATFVVLYALAQSDANAFKNIEEALKKAFTSNIFQNQTSIFESSNSIFEGQEGATNPLMLEYMSQKYEQTSYEEIKDEIEEMKKEGLSVEYDDRGLVIRLNELAIGFRPGTAELMQESHEILDKIARIIKMRFAIHYIQVEGHSDSDKINTEKYPSNWELSSARACSVVRHLIKSADFNPKLFIANGQADTVPLVDNSSKENKAKNRRVEIVILKNKNRELTRKDIQKIMQEAKLARYNMPLEKKEPSKAIEGLVGNDKELLKNVIDMSEEYDNEDDRLKQIYNDNYIHDGKKPEFMEQ